MLLVYVIIVLVLREASDRKRCREQERESILNRGTLLLIDCSKLPVRAQHSFVLACRLAGR